MKHIQQKESPVKAPSELKTQIIEYLRSYIPAELPPDHPRNKPSPDDQWDTHKFALPKETCEALQRLARNLSIDPRVVLVAGVRILHFRYSRTNQCALGLRAGAHNSIMTQASTQCEGTTLLCCPIDSDETVPMVAEGIAQAIRATSQFSADAWLSAIAELKWNKSDEDNQLIPIVVTFDDSALSNPAISVLPRRALFDTEWRFHRVEENIGCDVTYSRSLFKMESIRAFADNFADIVNSLLLESTLIIEAIPFTHAAEQLKQAQIPIDSPPQVPRSSLIDAFERVVAEHQDRVALVDGELSLTYRELDIVSSALAKRISETTRGEEKYEFISFCVPPSAIAIVAILGIIRYGAAYVPLDIRFPEERLAMLLNDSGARLLITTSESPEVGIRLPQVACLDISDFLTDWRHPVASVNAPSSLSYPSRTDLAYIMYTSGSTGQPKGVPIKQSSVIALVSNTDIFSFNPDDRVAQISNLAWDASTIDVWCTLLSGATLVCFNRYDVLDPEVLALQFKRCEIASCFMTPALLRQVVVNVPSLFHTLKTLILGGESIYYDSIRQLREINPLLTVQNVYGPTETCAVTTTFTMYPEHDILELGPVPIGRPLKTSQVLVVDSSGHLVPPGMIGELLIGGEGVAQGYLNRPAETSHAFINTEFEGVGVPPSVFYRSGDAVKWRPDGQLEFVSRLNIGQVKIRGQRLELAEVEATIVRTGLVKSAAVTIHRPVDGRDPFLVAYVTTTPSFPSPSRDNIPSKAQGTKTSDFSNLVETWRELYDDMYSSYDMTEARLKFLGWDSMVTGLPIPHDEMTAWLHDTMQPFFQQRPRTVFEVGCGSGIFLYQMAPFVEQLWAIEPSGEAVMKLNAQLQADNMTEKFSIWQGSADRIHDLPLFQPEFVLINSVVQYMPSEVYLRDMLVHIVDRCVPGSRILLGDIRSLPFEDLLGIDVILHEWKDELGAHTIQDLRERILVRNQNRTELLVDPTFFVDLQRLVPAITHVEIMPKVLEKSNELSQFRYQVLLHIGESVTTIVPGTWYDYQDLKWDSGSLNEALHGFVAGGETVLAVEHVPNKFLAWEEAVASVVFSSTSNAHASLASLPQQSQTSSGWSAWDLHQLAERYGVGIRLSFARQSQSTTLDIAFVKASMADTQYIAFKTADKVDTVTPCFSSRSLELSPKYSTHLERDVFEKLKALLPTHMIPEVIYCTASLPLLSNGKLDRLRVSAMAAADGGRGFDIRDSGPRYLEPEDLLEKHVCEIFAATLSCGSISLDSDFFTIGGNSLLATRLRATIQAKLGVRLGLRDLFTKSTPRDVASIIRQIGPNVDTYTRPGSTDLNTTRDADALSKGGYYPLSFAQGRLWFLAQANGPEDVSYNSGIVWELSGDLHIDALERTIREIVSRHEILRTIFVEVNGTPMTQVLDILPCLDVLDIAPTTSSAELQTLVLKSMMQPFRLDSEPAFRASLFRLSPNRCILLQAIHHIIWDGYSINVLRDEVAELYSAFSSGENHTLLPLTVQYKEFAQWQHTDAFEHIVQPQIDYWKTHLLGSQPAEFPADYIRPPYPTGGAAFHVSFFKPGTLQQLQNMCRRRDVTLFMWLLTVFRAVHYQLTGQEDASLGYPIANRNRFETGKMLGFFVNTQVYRLRVYPGLSFWELLQQTQALLLAAYENEDLPFDRLVSTLNPDRDLSRNPVVQIMCTHETVKRSPFSSSGMNVSPFHIPVTTTRFDLEVYFKTRDERLFMELFYSTDLFESTTIVHIAQRMQTLLEQVIQNPNLSIVPDQLPPHAVQPIIRDLINYLDNYNAAELPLDYVRPVQVRFDYQHYQFQLPEDICDALELLLTLRGIEEARLILLAALRVLHFRYSLSEDAAIGLCIENEIQSSRRFVVVRLSTGGNATFLQVLEDTRSAVAGVSKFSDISFSDMAGNLRSYGSLACDSIVHMMLSLVIGETESNPSPHEDRVHFDMEWQFCSVGEVYKCDLIYNGALFKRESIEAFSNNFIDIVESLLQESSFTVENIAFKRSISQLKQAKIPIELPLQVPSGSLAEAFYVAAAENKHKIALVDGQMNLTYYELDVLSSALAKRISEATQGQEKYKVISLCIPPSALAILAILGIVKYGAAYVPLDIRFPDGRLATLLHDSGAPLLITTSASPKFGTDLSHVIRLDISGFLIDWQTLTASLDAVNLPLYPSQTDLAYIMYTSGSTGKPKGVPIKQSSVLAFVSNTEVFPFGPDNVVAQIVNLAWDPSIIDVWCTLLSGATVVCFGQYDILDSPALASQFTEYRIDCCFMSPALFRQVLDIAPDLFRTLRTLILGGESIYYESLHRLREINHSLVIKNMYGPTETCVGATAFTIYPDDEMPESGPVPIGRPLKTSQVLVVDRSGHLVPPGVVGELLIGGQGVACGYLNRPAESSHAFIDKEFEGLNQPCSTFYRSGDAVKWRSDGQLEFIGRMDIGQVKIRGQRLELAEVEAMIIRTGLVKRAAVVYHKPADGRDPFLVAYIVDSLKGVQSHADASAPNSTTPAEEVRPIHRQLLDCLERLAPSFMVPQVIRSVPSLPLQPTGKLDRRQLETQTAAAAEALRKLDLHGEFEAPHDDIEQRLCEIFEHILNCAPIYRSSHFFASGGHSLLAQRLSLRVRHAFNVPLKVADIFEFRTPKSLAEKIRLSTSVSEAFRQHHMES